MATPKTVVAFRYRTEVIADITKHTSEFKKADETVEKYGKTIQKVAKDTSKAFDGAGAGTKFGKDFGASAVASIGSSFSVSTLGGLIGTAIAPGIGTAVGSAIGGGIDTALSKVTPLVLEQISGGIALNKLLEETRFEFKTFAGSEQEANKYLKELLDISKDVGILPQILIDASEKSYDLTSNLKLTRTFLKAATDQAADFGGSVEVFQKVVDVLGQMALRGEDVGRALKQAYQVGLNPYKRLAEATGMTPEQVKKLAAGGRIQGEVAARLIAESIEREKGGFAAARTGATVAGRERQFGVLMQLRAAEGTQNITRGIGDFYEKADAILNSPQAQKVVGFIDKYAGTLLDFTEKSLKVGVSVGGGIAEGLLNFSPATMMQSFTKLGGFVESGLKTVFEIKSPSERSAREIGVPIGEGIGLGVVRGLHGFIQGPGGEDIAGTLRELLKDPRVQALLKTVEWAEGGAPNRIVGGKTFSDMSRHPNIVGLRTAKGPSTAAGSYQITGTNWRKIAPILGLMDFSPTSQQMAALYLIVSHPGGMEALQSGDPKRIMQILALDWTSTPHSKIGGGGQKSEQSWMSHFSQFAGDGSGQSFSASNPMPVFDVMGGASRIFGRGRKGSGDGFQDNHPDAYLRDYTMVLGDADGAVVDLTVDSKNLTQTIPQLSDSFVNLLTSVQLPLRPMQQLIGAEQAHADSSIALTKKYQQAARQELIVGMSTVDQLSSALGQVAGMMPQQQVGKKRGLFSKILGIAAPFLSFIPGVGPILSQVAGMASAGLAGNWSGVASGLAGGLSPGGVFRSSGGGNSGSTGHTSGGGRASGGPGVGGRVYWTGEQGPEPFLAPSNGYFLSHRDAMRSMGGVESGGTASAIERLNAILARLEGVRPHDIVRMGARGYIDAMDRDAGLVRAHGQRLRLA